MENQKNVITYSPENGKPSVSINNPTTTIQKIRVLHIQIENSLQQLAATTSSSKCISCTNICCKEKFCRESIESDFLRFILGNKAASYDKENGWFDKNSGCTLAFGRPMVCYEYFCSQFDSDDKVLRLQQLSKEFSGLYAKIFRNQHILEIEDINLIPENRWIIVLKKLETFKSKCDGINILIK